MNKQQIEMQRDLHPTPEAVFAMFHWHNDYAKQALGSMGYFDSLTARDQAYCVRAVKAIKEA